MTTLIKNDNGQYIVAPSDTLSKIASTQGITLASLLAQNPAYQKNPNLIHPGDVVKVGAGTNAGFNLPPAPGNVVQQNSSDPTSSIYGLLTQILTDNQTKNKNQYLGNNTALLKGKENIGATNSEIYSQDMANANLTPSARLGILNSDTGMQDPGLKSIENQMKMNEAHYDATTGLLKSSMDTYDKEQDRIAKTKEAAAGPKLTASERYDSILGSYTTGFESGSMMPDGVTPITDSNGFVTPAAWKSAIADAKKKGISRKDFIMQHGDYLYKDNLSAYGLTPVEQGYITKPVSASSAETEAIINAILNK